jgi:mannose-6-phosphate isomerase-like protein (cupin superfamily)
MHLTDLDDAAPFVTAATAHDHVRTGEPCFITAASGRMRLDGEERDVRPGDRILIPPGARHELLDTGPGPLRPLWRCAAAHRHDDTVPTG